MPIPNEFAALADKKWSAASNSYARYFEPTTVVAGRFLLGMLKLRFRPNNDLRVLETGCGAGGLAKELLTEASFPNSSLSISELVLTDLSEGMLERTRGVLGEFLGDENKCSIRCSLKRADFTALDPSVFPNGYFDRYYSNLCLHYAEDPKAVMVESARVLKPGGIAGFTVWGSKATSPVMTIVPTILEGFPKTRRAGGGDTNHQNNDNKNKTKKRCPFHLGEDDASLRRCFLENGLFSKCTVVHYPAVLESLDPDDYVETILDGAPSTKKELEEDYTLEQQQAIRRAVREAAAALLANGEPLILDLAMVVAEK